ncbi:MAG: cardiolipin synthase [Culicoidibacterales bacterium]
MSKRRKPWKNNKSWFNTIAFYIVLASFISITCYTLYQSGQLALIYLFLTILAGILSFTVFLYIFLDENIDTSTKWAWILLTALLPGVGIVIYFLFGRTTNRIKSFKLKLVTDAKFADLDKNLTPLHEKIHIDNDIERSQIAFIERVTPRPFYHNTQTEVLIGEHFYAELIRMIDSAKDHVHMEFFIVRDDEVSQPIYDAMMRKAREGINVRFLIDAGGSMGTIKEKSLQTLVKSGVKVSFFGRPKALLMDSSANWRNHRKFAVIDGKVGFVGGFNIGNEYVYGNIRTQNWRDTHVKLTGDAVKSIQTAFIQDWYYSTEESVFTKRIETFFPDIQGVNNSGYVKLITDGPDAKQQQVKAVLFKLASSATSRIWITSPYLVPPDELIAVLKTAATSGVDVRIVIPQNPDKRFVYTASESYINELLQANVRVFKLKNCFQHSKIFIIDDIFAMCGSTNFDRRALEINFEDMALYYRHKAVIDLTATVAKDLDNSLEITKELWEKRAWYRHIFESVARLMAPLL